MKKELGKGIQTQKNTKLLHCNSKAKHMAAQKQFLASLIELQQTQLRSSHRSQLN